ncbi:MAG TPA: hypothetical protein VEK76_12720 [Candidatus Binatia bacterium]|nr:hypothetical protein [Candidatus Binatia bacterium]
MYQALRVFWRTAAVGGAIAVGLLTGNAGFTAITLFGGLIVPPLLGLTGPRRFARWARYGPGAFAGGRGWGGPWAAGGPGGGPGWGRRCGAGRGGWWNQQAWDEWHRQLHRDQPPESRPAAPGATTATTV